MIYAKVLYSIGIFIAKCLYQNQNQNTKSTSFSEEKHDTIIRLAIIAEKLFNFFVVGLNKEQRFGYTLSVNHEGRKLLIMPFILNESLMVSRLWDTYMKRLLDKVNRDDIVVVVGANIRIHVMSLAKKPLSGNFRTTSKDLRDIREQHQIK